MYTRAQSWLIPLRYVCGRSQDRATASRLAVFFSSTITDNDNENWRRRKLVNFRPNDENETNLTTKTLQAVTLNAPSSGVNHSPKRTILSVIGHVTQYGLNHYQHKTNKS